MYISSRPVRLLQCTHHMPNRVGAECSRISSLRSMLPSVCLCILLTISENSHLCRCCLVLCFFGACRPASRCQAAGVCLPHGSCQVASFALLFSVQSPLCSSSSFSSSSSSPFSPPLIEQLYSFFGSHSSAFLDLVSLTLIQHYSPTAFVTLCHGYDETSISLRRHATLAGALQSSTCCRFPSVRSRLHQISYARVFYYRLSKHM